MHIQVNAGKTELTCMCHVNRNSLACAPHVHVDTPDDGEEPSSDREVKRLTEYGDTTHLAGDGR